MFAFSVYRLVSLSVPSYFNHVSAGFNPTKAWGMVKTQKPALFTRHGIFDQCHHTSPKRVIWYLDERAIGIFAYLLTTIPKTCQINKIFLQRIPSERLDNHQNCWMLHFRKQSSLCLNYVFSKEFRFLSSLRRILPIGFLGRISRNSMCSGHLFFASCP